MSDSPADPVPAFHLALDPRPRGLPVLTQDLDLGAAGAAALPAPVPMPNVPADAPVDDPARAFERLRAVDSRLVVLPVGSESSGHCEAVGIVLHGRFSGSLKASKGPLVVMPGAWSQGHLESQGDLIIVGEVGSEEHPATVLAHGRLVLGETARVYGEVRYRRIEIYCGARHEGTLQAL